MAAPNPPERAFGVTNIKNHIPLILDFEEHNYDDWRELFLTHCLAFDVLGHIDGTSLPANDDDTPWKKKDGSARDIWLRIENQFKNNKEVRAIKLDHDLRTTEIGHRTVQEYCQTLKSTSDLLANLDAPVPDRTLVMYLINGLNEKFENIINVIKHKEPFPTFDSAKTMLLNEETRLKKGNKTPVTSDNASSPTVLVATTDKPQTQCFNNGNRKQNNRGRGRGRNNHQRNNNLNNNCNNSWNSLWPLPYMSGPMMQWPNYTTP
ncbi:uncharacterized protein LOC106412597 [Brassica napus]|uniref:uncharacterized protein LOC106412597 n=1 Tax=Brassica napus TaxID=3708 RepID=UPI0006AB6224|nr:uncharacterized protein LOC106412597 [Brassica napus]